MSRVNSKWGKDGGGVLCLIIIKCHWAKINGREAERLKDYITKWFPQKKKTHTHTHSEAEQLSWVLWTIVSGKSPGQPGSKQDTWKPGYLSVRMWVLACKDAPATAGTFIPTVVIAGHVAAAISAVACVFVSHVITIMCNLSLWWSTGKNLVRKGV